MPIEQEFGQMPLDDVFKTLVATGRITRRLSNAFLRTSIWEPSAYYRYYPTVSAFIEGLRRMDNEILGMRNIGELGFAEFRRIFLGEE